MKKTLTLMGIIALFAAMLSAMDKNDERYFTIDESSIKIEVVKDKVITKGGGIPLNPVPAPDDLPKPPEVKPSTEPQINPPINPGSNDFQNQLSNINSTLDAIDKIINIAQKIWEIIEKNQPVVNINVNYANAIPYGVQHWTQLQGWSKPATKKYSFSAKNLYGVEVVKVTYQVHYTYGGNLQGKGKFLTGVTVEPISVETAWGYKVSLTAEVPDSTIANVGTHEDPIASMQVQLKWTIHTALKDAQQKAVYYIQGDGLIQEIGSPFKSSDNGVKAAEQIKSAKF
ncbi:MAG: hypothetical protein K6357_00245 [Elusimicrobiota bacterium]